MNGTPATRLIDTREFELRRLRLEHQRAMDERNRALTVAEALRFQRNVARAVAVVFVLVLVLLAFDVEAKRLQHERVYAEAWCTEHGGTSEVTNTDGTRTDCVTLGYAIEADHVDKWPEALGQAVHYARLTERLPGILLIIERPDQCQHLLRAVLSIAHVRVLVAHYGQVPVRWWLTGVKDVCSEGAAL